MFGTVGDGRQHADLVAGDACWLHSHSSNYKRTPAWLKLLNGSVKLLNAEQSQTRVSLHLGDCTQVFYGTQHTEMRGRPGAIVDLDHESCILSLCFESGRTLHVSFDNLEWVTLEWCSELQRLQSILAAEHVDKFIIYDRGHLLWLRAAALLRHRAAEQHCSPGQALARVINETSNVNHPSPTSPITPVAGVSTPIVQEQIESQNQAESEPTHYAKTDEVHIDDLLDVLDTLKDTFPDKCSAGFDVASDALEEGRYGVVLKRVLLLCKSAVAADHPALPLFEGVIVPLAQLSPPPVNPIGVVQIAAICATQCKSHKEALLLFSKVDQLLKLRSGDVRDIEGDILQKVETADIACSLRFPAAADDLGNVELARELLLQSHEMMQSMPAAPDECVQSRFTEVSKQYERCSQKKLIVKAGWSWPVRRSSERATSSGNGLQQPAVPKKKSKKVKGNGVGVPVAGSPIITSLTHEALQSVWVCDLSTVAYPLAMDLSDPAWYQMHDIKGLNLVSPMALKTLDVSNNLLSDLDSLDGFSFLTSVVARSNRLANPMCALCLPRLLLLDLSGNLLEDIPDITQCPALQTLILCRNRLSGRVLDPAFARFLSSHTLQRIDFSSNNIELKTAMFAKLLAAFRKSLPVLEELSFSGNPLTVSVTHYRFLTCSALRAPWNAKFSVLDGHAVTHQERESGQRFFKEASESITDDISSLLDARQQRKSRLVLLRFKSKCGHLSCDDTHKIVRFQAQWRGYCARRSVETLKQVEKREDKHQVKHPEADDPADDEHRWSARAIMQLHNADVAQLGSSVDLERRRQSMSLVTKLHGKLHNLRRKGSTAGVSTLLLAADPAPKPSPDLDSDSGNEEWSEDSGGSIWSGSGSDEEEGQWNEFMTENDFAFRQRMRIEKAVRMKAVVRFYKQMKDRQVKQWCFLGCFIQLLESHQEDTNNSFKAYTAYTRRLLQLQLHRWMIYRRAVKDARADSLTSFVTKVMRWHRLVYCAVGLHHWCEVSLKALQQQIQFGSRILAVLSSRVVRVLQGWVWLTLREMSVEHTFWDVFVAQKRQGKSLAVDTARSRHRALLHWKRVCRDKYRISQRYHQAQKMHSHKLLRIFLHRWRAMLYELIERAHRFASLRAVVIRKYHMFGAVCAHSRARSMSVWHLLSVWHQLQHRTSLLLLADGLAAFVSNGRWQRFKDGLFYERETLVATQQDNRRIQKGRDSLHMRYHALKVCTGAGLILYFLAMHLFWRWRHWCSMKGRITGLIRDLKNGHGFERTMMSLDNVEKRVQNSRANVKDKASPNAVKIWDRPGRSAKAVLSPPQQHHHRQQQQPPRVNVKDKASPNAVKIWDRPGRSAKAVPSPPQQQQQQQQQGPLAGTFNKATKSSAQKSSVQTDDAASKPVPKKAVRPAGGKAWR